MTETKPFTHHGPAIITAWDVTNSVFDKKPITSQAEIKFINNEKKKLAVEAEIEVSSATCCSGVSQCTQESDVLGLKYIGGSNISAFRR